MVFNFCTERDSIIAAPGAYLQNDLTIEIVIHEIS